MMMEVKLAERLEVMKVFLMVELKVESMAA